MKTRAELRPVERAVEGYNSLIAQSSGRRPQPFPPEKSLAALWGVSQSAINRAAQRLIAAGRLRREGYKLLPVSPEEVTLTGARLAVLTHRAARLHGVAEEMARRGASATEFFYIGRDTLRRYLRHVVAKRFDGVITGTTDAGWEWDEEFAEFARLKIPCIVSWDAPAGRSMVAEDWRGATAQLVMHLVGSGHTELACLGSLRRASRSAAVGETFTETCYRLGIGESARRVHLLTGHTRESVQDALRTIRRRWSSVTALVLFDIDLLKPLLAAAKAEGIRIPDHLSLVVVGDSPDARANSPAITCVSFDAKMHAHVAIDLVCQQMLDVRRTGRMPAVQRVRLEGTFRARGSVLAITSRSAQAPVENVPQVARALRVWPQSQEARLREVDETWRWPHRLTAGARADEFVPVDLRPFANRSIHRPHGWLGHLPLQHLPTGRRRIHGVDFDLIDERRNDGRAAVVLRSSRATPAGRSVLPREISIPVGRKVRAVYFLHGCGYAGEPQLFAWYNFQIGRRQVSVPLVSRGIGVTAAPDLPEPNVQDWWPEFPQFNAPGVRHLVVTEEGDPFNYERYLYTLEWENPFPGEKLESIQLRSNTEVPTTLGVLAITVLCE